MPRQDRQGSASRPQGLQPPPPPQPVAGSEDLGSDRDIFPPVLQKYLTALPGCPLCPRPPGVPFPGLPGAMQPSFPLLLTEPKFSHRGCKGG